MAPSRTTCSLLCFACLLGLAFGNIVPNAILSQYTKQSAIVTEKAGTDESNPAGLAPITESVGKLVKGNFLATNWRDSKNNPGQGRTILQITPQGTKSVFATIPLDDHLVSGSCGDGNGNFAGVGLTAITVLSKGYVVVGSTPVPVGSTVPYPGCLLVLDSNGGLLDARPSNEATDTVTILTGGGPWAFAAEVTDFGATAHLFVSYVLGDDPTSTDVLTGAHGSKVVMYTLSLPGTWGPTSADVFWGPLQPRLIASGFQTTPGNISQGHVGPAGLALFQDYTSYGYTMPDGSVDRRLFIADTLENQIVSVAKAPGCYLKSGATLTCVQVTEAVGGVLDRPIGIAQSPAGTIVGANRDNGLLFEIATFPTGANLQESAQLVDDHGYGGEGALSQVMFHPQIPNTLFFTDDALNTINSLSLPTAGPSGRKLLKRH